MYYRIRIIRTVPPPLAMGTRIRASGLACWGSYNGHTIVDVLYYGNGLRIRQCDGEMPRADGYVFYVE